MKPGLSVYLIAGREAAVIGRCLDSVDPVATEIIVCLARGAQEPDETERIARARGARIVHYRNASDAATWPHVDDFAAARNTALDACQCAWRMWMDCDDVLPSDPKIHDFIRGSAKAQDVDAWSVLYDVRNLGLRILRRRITRGNSYRWVGAIHENLEPASPARERPVDALFPVHTPPTDAGGKSDRNLRILSRSLARTGPNAYYLQEELTLRGRNEEALLAGKCALAVPNLNSEMEWAVRWRLGGNPCLPPKERLEHLAFAYSLFPDRREALFETSCIWANAGEWDRARLIAEAAARIPLPATQYWNLLRFVYDWHTDDMIALCHAALGHPRPPRDTPPIISLCHATRGRMDKAVSTRLAWFRAADNPHQVEHIFGVDADDPEAPAFVPYGPAISTDTKLRSTGAWNAAAAKSTGKVIILLSDDMAPSQGWDTAVLEALGARIDTPAVLAIGDGNRPDKLLTLQVFTRARYEQQGWAFNPAFPCMFCDNDHTFRAYRDAVVIEARHIVFPHNHPAFGKGVMDDTYRRQNAPEAYQAGWETMLRLYPGLRTSQAVRDMAGLEWLTEPVSDVWLENLKPIDTPPSA